MTTLLQEKAFNLRLQAIKENKPKPMSRVLREAGYSKKAALHPKRVIESKGWQELLSEIDDGGLLKELKAIAYDKADKRAKLTAIDMLMKLKDKYPAGKLRVQQYREELNKLNE